MKKELTVISESCRVLRFYNEGNTAAAFEEPVTNEYIQMHFVLREQAHFLYNQGSYQLDGTEDQVLLLFNTQKDLPIHLVLDRGKFSLRAGCSNGCHESCNR